MKDPSELMEDQNESGLYVIHPAEEHEAPAENPHPAVGVKAVTAFLVTLDEDGHWLARFDIDKINGMQVGRLASMFDVLAACGAVTAEVSASMTANAVIQGQVQLSNQIAQQAEIARIQATLNNGGGRTHN